MSFLKSLFGGKLAIASGSAAGPIRSVEHDGYLIEAAPLAEGGQFLVAGTISRQIDGERKVHRFVRADRSPTIEDAAEMTLRKGRQIIEQVGTRMFDQT